MCTWWLGGCGKTQIIRKKRTKEEEGVETVAAMMRDDATQWSDGAVTHSQVIDTQLSMQNRQEEEEETEEEMEMERRERRERRGKERKELEVEEQEGGD